MTKTAKEFRIYALLGYSARSGAATTCVGFLGLEETRGAERVALIPSIPEDGDGGWAERIERAREARGITPETVTFWEEASNGIVWGIAELPPDEFASDVSLDAALDRLVDEVLMNPDPDPSFLDWLESRIG